LNSKDLARIINNPHDHYFKHTFGKPEVAKDYLKSNCYKEKASTSITKEKAKQLLSTTEEVFAWIKSLSQYE